MTDKELIQAYRRKLEDRKINYSEEHLTALRSVISNLEGNSLKKPVSFPKLEELAENKGDARRLHNVLREYSKDGVPLDFDAQTLYESGNRPRGFGIRSKILLERYLESIK